MLYSLEAFRAEYPDDRTCLELILRGRHGGLVFPCPACAAPSRFHRVGGRRAYVCQRCGHHLYPCAGGLFARSRTPLVKWFYAIYLITAPRRGARRGIRAAELQRALGVTYKCAWRMKRALRSLAAEAEEAA